MPGPRPPSDAAPSRLVADAEARREREAAALRENLRRRKEQARARQAPGAAPPGSPPDPPA